MSNYDLPAYICDECDSRPWLMSDETAGVSQIGIGCKCTLEDGKPFKMLGGNPVTMPERWVKSTKKMVVNDCPECDWKPDADSEYPEDRLIEHYDEEHTNG